MSKYEFDISEKSINFSKDLLKYLYKIEKHSINGPIINQLVRSGTSIGANIHEAQSSGSRIEMRRYYRIALKSANESRYWFILLESLVGENKEINALKSEVNNFRNILGKTVLKLSEAKEIAKRV